jgi:voltage-gated potassium channel
MISLFSILMRFVWAVRGSWRDPEFRGLAGLVIVTLLAGTLFYSEIEGWNLLDSLYFSVVTLTTVGYGDLSPSTATGKFFTIFYIFVGLGIILAFVNAVAERAMERQSKGKDEGETESNAANKRSLASTPPSFSPGVALWRGPAFLRDHPDHAIENAGPLTHV